MKKLLAWILAALAIASFSACKKDSEDEKIELKNYLEEEEAENSFTTESGETFHYERIDSTRVMITGYASGDEKHALIIPETLDDKKVTKIGEAAFKNCTAITSVQFPATLEVIGGYAFANCALIKEAVIPASVTEIGDGAFVRCYGLEKLTFAEGSTLKAIAKDTFNECKALTAISIPSSVKTVGDKAFFGCIALKSVIIAEGTAEIGKQAFQNCVELETLCLPASLTTFDEELAFGGCNKLTAFYYGGTAEDWAKIVIKQYNEVTETWDTTYIGNKDNKLNTLTRYDFAETQPTADGNFWHYVDGVITAW